MSNSFPPVPPNLSLAQIEYAITIGSLQAVDIPPSSPFYFDGTVVTTDFVAPGNQSVWSPVKTSLTFNFRVPGSYGTFDQAAVEGTLTTWLNSMCQAMAAFAGIPLLQVQGQTTVSRTWLWKDPNGNTATFADTLSYP